MPGVTNDGEDVADIIISTSSKCAVKANSAAVEVLLLFIFLFIYLSFAIFFNAIQCYCNKNYGSLADQII